MINRLGYENFERIFRVLQKAFLANDHTLDTIDNVHKKVFIKYFWNNSLINHYLHFNFVSLYIYIYIFFKRLVRMLWNFVLCETLKHFKRTIEKQLLKIKLCLFQNGGHSDF